MIFEERIGDFLFKRKGSLRKKRKNNIVGSTGSAKSTLAQNAKKSIRCITSFRSNRTIKKKSNIAIIPFKGTVTKKNSGKRSINKENDTSSCDSDVLSLLGTFIDLDIREEVSVISADSIGNNAGDNYLFYKDSENVKNQSKASDLNKLVEATFDETREDIVISGIEPKDRGAYNFVENNSGDEDFLEKDNCSEKNENLLKILDVEESTILKLNEEPDDRSSLESEQSHDDNDKMSTIKSEELQPRSSTPFDCDRGRAAENLILDSMKKILANEPYVDCGIDYDHVMASIDEFVNFSFLDKELRASANAMLNRLKDWTGSIEAKTIKSSEDENNDEQTKIFMERVGTSTHTAYDKSITPARIDGLYTDPLFIKANPFKIAKLHSGIDVHKCSSITCNSCFKSSPIEFISCR